MARRLQPGRTIRTCQETPLIAQRPSLQAPASPTSRAPDALPLDLIFIEGFTGQTVIGIHDSELHRPQTIRIDLTAGLPRTRACDTDSIRDTIDYGVVRERLQRLLGEHRLSLLEPFAEEVAHILIGEFGAHWVRVVVAKPRKFDDVESVGVAIERWREIEPAGSAVAR
ncbi:MAG: dihydroneopterin aldolase [Methylibium sp.]|nr:dihydroneopterin aldolase [Methylibium sp.]MBA3588970.1 dihydroneopterin aldolase [Methylibium sp.]